MKAKSPTNILVPKETVSDDVYRVTELTFAQGGRVASGDIIGTLETSKADFEIEAPVEGFIQYKVASGNDIAAGKVFAVINPDPEGELIATENGNGG